MAIITTLQAKQYLSIESANTEYDSFISDLISHASSLIENWINQPVETTSKEIIFNGNGADLYLLPNAFISTISKLYERADLGSAWIELATTEFSLEQSKEGFYIYKSDSFTAGRLNYKVVYSTGYTTIPNDIKHVCLEVVATFFKNSDVRERGRLGLNSISDNFAGSQSTTQFLNLETQWRNRLSKYRLLTI